jgi:hypothetical protein
MISIVDDDRSVREAVRSLIRSLGASSGDVFVGRGVSKLRSHERFQLRHHGLADDWHDWD